MSVLGQSHVRDKKASCVKEYLDTEFKKSLENSNSQKNLKEVQGASEWLISPILNEVIFPMSVMKTEISRSHRKLMVTISFLKR